MFAAKGRYALMAILIVAAGVFIYEDQHQLAAICGLMFAFLIWSHYKHSSVVMASKFFQKGDYTRAGSLLAEVPNPDRLARSRRGFYEFMMGNISLKQEEYEAAERHFQIASRFPLGNKNDKAFVMIHLANLALRKQDRERGKAYVERAKELATSSKAQEVIGKLEKEINKL